MVNHLEHSEPGFDAILLHLLLQLIVLNQDITPDIRSGALLTLRKLECVVESWLE